MRFWRRTGRHVSHLIPTYGLSALFLAVMLESAGMPVPGETALIAASVLAAQGLLSLPLVIVIAAAAAIIGDNAGYWIGRAAGRRLLERWQLIARYASKMLPPAERFYAHHGGKAVFLARFIPGLRVIGALVAGIAGMEWWRFLLWNVAGRVGGAANGAHHAHGPRVAEGRGVRPRRVLRGGLG